MLPVLSTLKNAWDDAKFTELQRCLETTVVQLAENKEKCDSGKENLIELLNQFRTESSQEVRKSVSPLLTCFQEEIDTLNGRSVFIEDAYLHVFKVLAQLPDPVFAIGEALSLKSRVENVESLESEIKQLKTNNKELKQKLSSLKKNESENKRLTALVNELKEKVEDQSSATQVTALKRELEHLADTKDNELMAMKGECDETVITLEQKCMNLSTALSQARSEIFELKGNLETVKATKSSELELLQEELENANAKLRQLDESPPTDRFVEVVGSDSEHVRDLENQLEELQVDLVAKANENHKLATQLSDLATTCKQDKESYQTEMDRLQITVRDLEEKLVSGGDQLTQIKSDYDEANRELELIKTIEFGSEPADAKLPFEQVVARQCRTLQHRVTSLDNENSRLRAEVSELNLANQEARIRDHEQSQLIQSLESNLHQLNLAYSQQQGSSDGLSPSAGQSEGQLLASVIGGEADLPAMPTSERKASAHEHSLLQIVQNQRDRFHSRMQELEQTEGSLRQQLTSKQSEVDGVRQDNVKLYEKIRFLQSYDWRSSNNEAAASKIPPADHVSIVPLPRTDAVSGRYSRQYEDGLNAFQRFTRNEHQRSYSHMAPHEKVMYHFTHLMTDSRLSRLITFVYVLVLHFLVFLALYYGAYFQNSAYEAEQSCLTRYAEHMESIHNSSEKLHPPNS